MAGVQDEALARLAARARFSVRLGLERVQRALAALGRPERRFASVHLAGTNGKGSTAAMVAACLSSAGHRTGLFTSPHLHRFSERIRVGGVEIPAPDLERLLHQVLSLDDTLTFFEVATVVAFCYFAERQVEVAVVETGLGGRLDATNVLAPRVSTITPIGLDHMSVLGSDLGSIAAEKAGIVKPDTAVVCAPQADGALAPLMRRCEQLRAPLRLAGRDFSWSTEPTGRLSFSGWRSRLAQVRVGLRGAHQRQNAAVALATLDLLAEGGLDSDAQARRSGLANVRWPGRLEWVGRFLLDCAHNPAATRALLAELPAGDWTLVYGTSQDKQADQMLRILGRRVGRVIVTRFAGSRAMGLERLLSSCPGANAAGSVNEALARARETGGPVLVTGSVFLVAEARQLLLRETVDATAVTDPPVGPGSAHSPPPTSG